MNIILQVFLGLVLADFSAGFFHWFEDTYLQYCTSIPILSSVAKHNELHHYFPRLMLVKPWWKTIQASSCVSLLLITILLILTPQLIKSYPIVFITAVLFGSLSNLFHKYSHMRDCERPRIIAYLHCANILVTHEHHKQHHENPLERYNVIFPWMNWILDTCGFWRGLEFIIAKVFNVHPTRKQPFDSLVKSIGPVKAHAMSKQSCPPPLTPKDIYEIETTLASHYRCA